MGILSKSHVKTQFCSWLDMFSPKSLLIWVMMVSGSTAMNATIGSQQIKYNI
jgi:hypothetical protein